MKGRGVLALLLLLGVVGPGFAQSRTNKDESTTTPAQEGPGFSFSDAPTLNAGLESGLESVSVGYADGRPSETLTLHRRPEGPYLTLGDVGRITGQGFRWDPETWKGSFQVDGREVRFTLDAAVFWIGEEGVNLPAPVRYESENVLIPLSAVDGVIAPILGNRCRWDPAGGQLELALSQPWLDPTELAGGGSSASLNLAPVRTDAIRFRWDPTGRLEIDIKGVHVPPGIRPPARQIDGLSISSVNPSLRGCEIAVAVEPPWIGVRVRPGRAPQSVLVEFTSQQSEVQRARFEPLAAYLNPRSRASSIGPGRRIVIDLTGVPSTEQRDGECMRILAERLRISLEQDFGHTVIPVEDRGEAGMRSPSGMPEVPGMPEGDCWIGFRLESWPSSDAREFLLVVSGAPAREEPVAVHAMTGSDADLSEERGAKWRSPSLQGAQAVPWGQVSRVYRVPSTNLARTIADHLGRRWEDRPVRIAARPARIFRGMAMPGVLIYPAAKGDREATDALCDEMKAGDLARNLAFALDEFLLGYSAP